MEFDYTKPAFALYLNVTGQTKQFVDTNIQLLEEKYGNIDNMFIFTTDTEPTRIECFYNPVINNTLYRP